MSRAASMQVLNNAFSNLNNAMATIMQNNRQNRAMDMQQQYQNDLLNYRQLLADRAQANADRTYNYNVSQDAQAQENWEKTHADTQAYRNNLQNYREKQDAEAHADAERQRAEQKAREQELATQNDFKEMFGISKVYGAGMAEAYARAKAGDPVAKNIFMQGVEQHSKKQELQKKFAGLLANLDAIKKQQILAEQAKQKANEQNFNRLLNFASRNANEDLQKIFNNYEILKALSNGAGATAVKVPLMTPEEKNARETAKKGLGL